MSEDKTEGKVDWVIGKNVNLSGFTLEEIREAREAGIEFEVNADRPDQSKVIKKSRQRNARSQIFKKEIV